MSHVAMKSPYRKCGRRLTYREKAADRKELELRCISITDPRLARYPYFHCDRRWSMMDSESAAPRIARRTTSIDSRILRLINVWPGLFRGGSQQNDINGESYSLINPGKRAAKTEEEHMVEFIRQSFCRKECRQFDKNPLLPGRCITCHGYYVDHYSPVPLSALQQPITFATAVSEVQAINFGRGLSYADANKFLCTETNAFGRLEFIPKSDFKYRQPPKFVRLAYDGVPNSMRDPHTINNAITLLTKYWHLREPDLVISVIGGGEKFRISNRRRQEIFNSGLIKAISATNGWLLTVGSNTGIAKAVGDAVREGQTLRVHSGHVSKQIACIGITSWGNVRQRSTITCLQPDKVHHLPSFDYKVTDAGGGIGMMLSQEEAAPSDSGIDQQGLNPDHTHFLLVDDGRRYEKSGVAEFRSALEHKLKETFARTSVVCLCVEGGAHSLSQVYESLTKGTSVLVCKGSGRISDLIAKCYYDPRRMKDKDKWLKSIREQLVRLFRERDKTAHNATSAKSLDKMCHQIAFICNSPHLSIFKFEHRKDLDIALLQCIMSAKMTNSDNVKHDEGVELALSWNRDDIAEEIISQPFYDIEKPLLFHKAILENKVKFVQLFVKNGIVVSRYLTAERLTDLYRKTNKTHLMEAMNIKDQSKVTLTDVSSLINQLTGCPGRYGQEQLLENCDPFHELIIYAVLFNRRELALYFWNHCQRPLLTALIGTWLSDRLLELYARQRDEGCVKDFTAMKRAFETKAIGLLDTAYNNSEDWAHKLVTASASFGWSTSSCMQIAAMADAKDFLGHECCQSEIFNDWNKGFRCNRTKFFLSFFLVFPMFFDYFVRFEQDDGKNSRESRRNSALDSDDQIEINFRVSRPPTERWHIVREKLSTIREQKWVAIEEPPPVKNLNSPKTFFLDKPYIFYNAPVSTFTWHAIFFMLYLALYSHVMLFAYHRHKISQAEYLLYFWQFTFFIETFYAVCLAHGTNIWAKLTNWWAQGFIGIWNHFDTINTILAFAAVILRLASEEAHPFARLIMVVNVVIYFQRLFKAFFANSYLGPKVIMIWKMTKELMMFCLFFFVFMLSYSVASQSLIHVEREPYPGIVWHLFGHGLWEIFGEPSEDAMGGIIEGCNNYTGLEWLSSSHAIDCFLRTKPLPVFLTLYLFFTSVLLVNMLIAVFSHIFDTVEENAQQLWKFQMYFLVEEYRVKSVVPPPFILFYHIYLAGAAVVKRYLCPTATAPEKSQIDSEFLRTIENVCRSEYVDRQMEEELQQNYFQIGIDKLTEEIKRQPNSFDHDNGIPLSPADNSLRKHGVVVYDEDNKWPVVHRSRHSSFID